MSRPLVVLPQARVDVAEIFRYFEAIDPRLAMRFYDAFDSALPLIESMPEAAGRLLLDERDYLGYRFCRLKGFKKYLLIYRVTHDAVQIVRVLHGSRDLPAVLQEH